MNKKVILYSGIGVVVLAGAYILTRNKTPTNMFSNIISSGYSRKGGISTAAVAGLYGQNGTPVGNTSSNTYADTSPITPAFNSSGQLYAMNMITGQTINPSSWQGTTNKSGSITYLNGQLAGEGSGNILLRQLIY